MKEAVFLFNSLTFRLPSDASRPLFIQAYRVEQCSLRGGACKWEVTDLLVARECLTPIKASGMKEVSNM